MAFLGMGLEYARPRANPARHPTAPHHATAAALATARRHGTVILITGPSGSGKSTLLRHVHAYLIARATRCALVEPHDPPRVGSLIDALGSDAPHAVHCLTACGLADATLWPRAPSELSEGERARFAAARALAALVPRRTGEPPPALLWDECASVLDRTTAHSVCVNLARNTRREGLAALCATAHDDAAAWLRPDLHVHCRLDRPPTVQAAAGDHA